MDYKPTVVSPSNEDSSASIDEVKEDEKDDNNISNELTDMFKSDLEEKDNDYDKEDTEEKENKQDKKLVLVKDEYGFATAILLFIVLSSIVALLVMLLSK